MILSQNVSRIFCKREREHNRRQRPILTRFEADRFLFILVHVRIQHLDVNEPERIDDSEHRPVGPAGHQTDDPAPATVRRLELDALFLRRAVLDPLNGQLWHLLPLMELLQRLRLIT